MSFLIKRVGSFSSFAETLGLVILVLIVLTIGRPVRAGQVNIVAVGASTTAGKRVGLEAAYPALLESMLRAKGYDVSIRDEGISGDTSSGMLGRIDSAAPAGTGLMLLQIAHSNDANVELLSIKQRLTFTPSSLRLTARNIKVIFVNRHVPSGRTSQWMVGIRTQTVKKLMAARLLPQVMALVGSPR